MLLTDLSIKTLKAPPKGSQIYSDDVLTGFGVRVSEGGTKSFVLTHGVRRERETIGHVGIISLQSARTEAKRRLAEYTLGKTQPVSIGWDAAKEEYLKAISRKRKPRTVEGYRYILDKHFKFGPTKLADLSQMDLQKKLDRISDRPALLRRGFAGVRAFLNWAYSRYYMNHRPLERMQTPEDVAPRTRILSDLELRKVWLACQDLGLYGTIVRLLILTGQRRGEITQLSPQMLGDGTVTLPSWLAKNSIEHTFPVGPMAASMLSAAASSNEQDTRFFIFPAEGNPEACFDGFSKCKARLDKLSGVQVWTLHDLRRTFASGLAALGVSLPAIERLLNHISGSFGGIVGVYQRYNFAPEMRAAIDKWEAHVQQLVA